MFTPRKPNVLGVKVRNRRNGKRKSATGYPRDEIPRRNGALINAMFSSDECDRKAVNTTEA